MPQVLRSAEARLDIRGIVWHIAQDNPAAAENWLGEIEHLFSTLASQPFIGERTRTRRFGVVRRFSRGFYLVYYRPLETGVEILRVVHGLRDQTRLT